MSMDRFVRCLRRTLFSTSSPSITYRNPRIGLPTNQNPKFLISSGSYVSEMQKSAFQGNILRLIHNGIEFDWHVVQFIIVCLPSVAVYLVAQYARHKMKIMDAELGEKKRKEEEKKEKEEAEQKAVEEEAATKSHKELIEMKERLGKIEETIKEIILETKKPSGNPPTKSQEDQSA